MIPTGYRQALEPRGLRRRGGVVGAVLVLAGAKVPELKQASALAASVADRCLLVAVDGGLKTCRAAKRRPDLFVGDADSFRRPPADLESVRFPQDKDFSDLAGAIAQLKRRRVQVAAVAGLLGGRLDHEWANLLELAQGASQIPAIVAPTSRGTVVITRHGCRVATVRQRTVSIFALNGTATISLKGTRWELARRRIRPGSHGLSNVTGTEFDLTVHSGTAAVVFIPPRRRRN